MNLNPTTPLGRDRLRPALDGRNARADAVAQADDLAPSAAHHDVQPAAWSDAMIGLMIGLLRLFNCALLLILTGAATIWLRITIEPYLPPGEWHAMLTGLFLCVLWPALAWSLCSLARVDLSDLNSMMWWW